MGFIANMFMPDQVPLAPEMPIINTVMSPANIANIRNGRIMAIPVKKLVMKKSERCLFCDYAVRITEKLCIVDRHSNRYGASFRICRGLTWRVGTGDCQQIRDKIPEYSKGKLYITNKRIVFSSDSGAFQRTLNSLISYRIEDGCLILQFNNSAYRIYLPVADCAEIVLSRVV